MRQVETKKIGDHNYQIRQLPPMDAIIILTRLVKILGAPFAATMPMVMGAFEGGDGAKKGLEELMKKEVDEKLIGSAISALMGNMDEDFVKQIINDLMKTVDVSTKSGGFISVLSIFDTHFQGKIADVFLVIAEALRVNYSDFLLEILAALPEGNMAKKMAAAFSKKETSKIDG